MTIGREDDVETLYDLIGSVDEVKLWNKEIPVSQIEQLKNEWATPAGIINNEVVSHIYPNPVRDVIYIELNENTQAEQISLLSLDGREMKISNVDLTSYPVKIEVPQVQAGVYLLRIKMKYGSFINKKVIIL